jgi:hypothetical protein
MALRIGTLEEKAPLSQLFWDRFARPRPPALVKQREQRHNDRPTVIVGSTASQKCLLKSLR